jgi:hypothetical protein
LPHDDKRDWERNETDKKEWNPTRVESKSQSPEGKEWHLAQATTQDESPTGEKGEKPSLQSKSGCPAPTTKEREQQPIRRTRRKAGDSGSKP